MSVQPQKPKPGLGLAIGLPVAIWIAFSIVAVVLLVLGFARYSDVIDDFARIDAGQPTVVELRDAGGYTVWVEGPDTDAVLRPVTSLVVTAPDGSDVPVETYDSEVTYSDGNREGTAVHTFRIDQPGDFTITGTLEGSTTGSTARFAIGRTNPVSEIGKGFALFFIVGTVGFLIALVLLIVLLVRRGRSKRALRPPVGGPGYGTPTYGTAPGYGPTPGAPGGYGIPGYGAPPSYGGAGAGTSPPAGPFGSPPASPPAGPPGPGTPPPPGWGPPS